MNLVVAAFDFDGTLTTRDTMLEYLRFVKGDFAYYKGMIALLPMLFQMKLGWISPHVAKEKMLTFFLGNETESFLYQKGKDFCETRLPQFLRPNGLARIAEHQQKGHTIFLVTASLSFWTMPFAQKYQLHLLATEPEIQNGKFTGKIKGENCNGIEKVNRLQEVLKESLVTDSFAYGDSKGDKPLLAWAKNPFYRPFHT